MTRLIRPDELTLTPDPGRASGATYARTRARVLLAWRRGERPDLLVEHDGAVVAPDQIDWSRVDGSSGPSGPHRLQPISIRQTPEILSLAGAWATSPQEAVRRAVALALASISPQKRRGE